jgi:hypothetical protein
MLIKSRTPTASVLPQLKTPSKAYKVLNKTFDRNTINHSETFIDDDTKDISICIPGLKQKLIKRKQSSNKKEEIILINNLIDNLTKLKTIIMEDDKKTLYILYQIGLKKQ